MLYLVFVIVFLVLWGCFYAVLPALRRTSAVSARLFARLTVRYARINRFSTRLKAYAPIVLVVIIGGLVVAWAGDQFIDLAELVRGKSAKLQDLDTVAHARALPKRTAADTSFFVVRSDIGSP